MVLFKTRPETPLNNPHNPTPPPPPHTHTHTPHPPSNNEHAVLLRAPAQPLGELVFAEPPSFVVVEANRMYAIDLAGAAALVQTRAVMLAFSPVAALRRLLTNRAP